MNSREQLRYDLDRQQAREERATVDRHARLDADDAPLDASLMHIGLRRRVKQVYGVEVPADLTGEQVDALHRIMAPHILDDTPRPGVRTHILHLINESEAA